MTEILERNAEELAGTALPGRLASRFRDLGLLWPLRGLAGPDRITAEADALEMLPGLCPEARALLELAVLAHTVNPARASQALTPGLARDLAARGLLRVQGDRVDLGGRALLATPYGLLLADAPLGFPGVVPRPAAAFADDESLPLCDAVARAHAVERALDVGCGAGLTTLAAARTALHVTAVDLQPEAVLATRFNAAMAGLADRVQVHVGDLDRSLPPAARFDRIVAGLPALPLPEDALAPAHAGGAGGSAVACRLLARASRRLRPGGELWIGASVQLREGAILPGALGEALERLGADVQWIRGAPVRIDDAVFPLARMIGRDQPVEVARWLPRIRAALGAGGADSFAPALFRARLP